MEINIRCLGSFLAQFEKLRTLSSSIPCVHLYDGNLGKTFSLLIRIKLAGGVTDAYTNKTVVIVTMIIVIMIVIIIALTDPTPIGLFKANGNKLKQIS